VLARIQIAYIGLERSSAGGYLVTGSDLMPALIGCWPSWDCQSTLKPDVSSQKWELFLCSISRKRHQVMTMEFGANHLFTQPRQASGILSAF
jgi:hypothetical protein